jgi:hypothetical protein
MSPHEILVLLIAILVVWVLLKVAKVAIKLIFITVAMLALAGVLWFVFMR